MQQEGRAHVEETSERDGCDYKMLLKWNIGVGEDEYSKGRNMTSSASQTDKHIIMYFPPLV